MSGYVGFISETAWGTPPGAVDKFVPVLSSNLTPDMSLMRLMGIRSGRRTHVPGLPGARKVSGQVSMELPTHTLATLLKHMMGAVSTTGPVSSLYTHVTTPGAAVGASKSLVLSTVVDDSGGTAIPFTATGVKFDGWEIACQAEQFAMLTLDWTGRDFYLHRTVTDGATTITDATVTSATAAFTAADLFKPISGTGIPANSYIGVVTSGTSVELSSSNAYNVPVNATATGSGLTLTLGTAAAAASYASGLTGFTFVQATVYVNLVAVASARTASLKAVKGLKNDRFTLGKAYISEQLELEKFDFTCDLLADFEATTGITMVRTAAAAGTLLLGLTFSNGVESLTISGQAQPIGDLPSLTSNGLEEQALRFQFGHASSDASAITATLVNTDVLAT